MMLLEQDDYVLSYKTSELLLPYRKLNSQFYYRKKMVSPTVPCYALYKKAHWTTAKDTLMCISDGCLIDSFLDIGSEFSYKHYEGIFANNYEIIPAPTLVELIYMLPSEIKYKGKTYWLKVEGCINEFNSGNVHYLGVARYVDPEDPKQCLFTMAQENVIQAVGYLYFLYKKDWEEKIREDNKNDTKND